MYQLGSVVHKPQKWIMSNLSRKNNLLGMYGNFRELKEKIPSQTSERREIRVFQGVGKQELVD